MAPTTLPAPDIEIGPARHPEIGCHPVAREWTETPDGSVKQFTNFRENSAGVLLRRAGAGRGRHPCDPCAALGHVSHRCWS